MEDLKYITFLLIFLVSSTSCQFDVPTSHSFDSSKYNSDCQGNSLYVSACTVLVEKCVSCHSGFHDEWYSFAVESDWTGASGSSGGKLVTLGNRNASLLWTRLRLNGGDMPPSNSGVTFTTDDKAAIAAWIDSGALSSNIITPYLQKPSK